MQKNLPNNIHAADLMAHACLALVTLIAILPFINPIHTAPLVSFYSEWLALALGFAGCLAFLTRRFWSNFDIPKIVFYLLALLAIVVIQWALIPRPYIAQTLIPAIYLIWAMLLMVLAVWLRTSLGTEQVVAALAWSLFIGGLLASLIGLVQYLGIAGWFAQFVAFKRGTAVYGNIAQANHFATHVTLGAAAVIFLFSRAKLSRLFSIMLVTFLAMIVALSGSRSVTLYAGGIISLSAVCYFRNRDKQNYRLLSASIYFFVAFLCAQYLFAWVNPWLMEQLADVSRNTDPFSYTSAVERLPTTSLGWQLRISEWRKAWLMFTQAPILGVGIGNYAWHSFALQSLPEFKGVLKPDLFAHSHNIFAQILAETGIVGLASLILLIVSWVNQFKKSLFTPNAWLIAGVLLTLFIHSNLEFPLWYSYFLGIAAFLLGLGETRTVRVTFSPGLGRFGAAVALVLIASTLLTTLDSYRKISNLPDPRIEPQEQINMLLAHGTNPILTPYTDLILLTMMPTNKDAIADKLSISTRQFYRNPDSYKAYKQITLLALDGQVTEAKELLNRTAQAYPSYVASYLNGLKNLSDVEIQELREYGLHLASSAK